MTEFLLGGTVVAAAAIALAFLRYWSRTREPFFALFGVAFALFAVNRVAVFVVDDVEESGAWVYTPRLLGFLLIIAAIVEKNRSHE